MRKTLLSKIMLLLCALIVGSGSAWATDVETTSFTATSGNVGNDINVTFTSYQGGGTSTPVTNNNCIRLYQKTGGGLGGYIVIGVSENYVITDISITPNATTTAGYMLTDTDPGSTTPNVNSFVETDHACSQNTAYAVNNIYSRYVVFGNFGNTNSNSTRRLDIKAISVTYQSTSNNTPSISVGATTIDALATAVSTTSIEVTYNNLTNYDAEVIFYDADGTTSASYDHSWLTAEINASTNNLDYSITANTGAARTAYLKVYAIGDEGNAESELITITQAAATATALAVKTAPTKLNYKVGETLDLTGLVLDATIGGNHVDVTTGYTASPANGATLNSVRAQTVTFTYDGQTTTQTIHVGELTGIAITTAPTKTTYYEGQTFDPTGMVVTATFSDGEESPTEWTEDVTAACTFDPDTDTPLEISDTEVTVTYIWSGVTKTADQDITVTTIPTHTAHFSVNGTIDNNNNCTVAEGAAITFPSNPEAISGKSFVGWTTATISGTTNTAPTPLVTSATMGNSNITYYAVFADVTGTTDASWTETAIGSLTSSDIFVIVGNNGNTYALPSADASSSPSATSVTIDDSGSSNKIDETGGAVANNLKWNISGNSTDGYTFYPNGSTTKYLYLLNDNRGVRVGTPAANTTEDHTFTLTNGYLTASYTSGNTTTNRYMGIYNSQDWRCYTSTDGNIAGQTFAFYKYTAGSSTYANYCTSVVVTYSVTYDGNGASSGSVPTDNTAYTSGQSVTVAGNTGNLAKTGYTFGGWNTRADGQGTNYAANATFNITDNTTLYAKWNVNETPEITVTVDGPVNVVAENSSGKLALTYANLTISAANDFAVQFYDANDNELQDEPDWIAVVVEAADPSGYQVSYEVEANDVSSVRSAYFKVFAMGDQDYVYSNKVTITQAAGPITPPTINLASGFYSSVQSVTITTNEDGGTTYYTTDGSAPTDASTEYTGAISITTTTTLKAITYKGENYSSISSATYTIFVVEDGVFDFVEAAKAGYDYGSGVELTNSSSTYVTESKTWIAGNVTMVTARVSGSGYRWWSNDKTLRFYNESTATFSVPDGYAITEIVTTGANFDDADTGELSSDTWTGLANEVKLTATGGRNIKTISVAYVPVESVTVTSAGYATYASDNALDFTNSSIKAYIATTKGDGSGVTFTQINKIPANTGVLLHYTGGKTEDIPVFDGTGANATTGNKFVVGAGTTVASDDGTNYNYILNNVGGNIGFYKANGKNVAKNRAYISILKSEGTPIGVKEFFSIDLGEEGTDGIGTIDNGQLTMGNEDAIYNLAGQRVQKPVRGLYIKNGKKILVK